MTKQEAINKLLTWAREQIGTREGANNWNRYAPIVQPLIGWNAQNQPWCDIFTDAGFIECFGLENAAKMTYQPIGGGSAACRYSAQFFKDAGAWSDTPHAGDVIFFYSGGEINHQGFVADVGMGAISTIEGNSGDMVAKHSYAIGSPQIAGYGVPNWGVVTGEQGEAQESAQAPEYAYFPYTYNVAVSLLKLGNYGPQVLHMQQLLAANGYPCSDSGRFDEETRDALLAFQEDAGIDVDGEFGGQSFKALWNCEVK